MKITALCPTFRHPQLLANSLAMWEWQSYPEKDRYLYICDDGGTFDSQRGPNWEIVSVPTRFPSLTSKYNWMLANAPSADVYAIWEDDDIYLPDYFDAHYNVLQNHDYSRPLVSRCHYGNKIENVNLHYHASQMFSSELIHKINGWPDTKRADFDFTLRDRLAYYAKSIGAPWVRSEDSQFIMGFSSTGAAHCSSNMKSFEDETWYDRCVETYDRVPKQDKLIAKLDKRTEAVLTALCHETQEVYV